MIRFNVITSTSGFRYPSSLTHLSHPCSFSTSTGLVFEDQFLQISALLPSTNIYGLGEHTTRLRLPTNTTLTMFSQDTAPLPSVSHVWGSRVVLGLGGGMELLSALSLLEDLDSSSSTHLCNSSTHLCNSSKSL